ncbi:MAG: hypothetical protein J7496_08785 [Novosphingobium sp.]|nr:hypothetical protein [Novosphingobium sp.]
MAHALVRTNPKGQPFIGKCAKCGAEGLTLKQANEECVNPAGLDWQESFELTMRVLDHRDRHDA